MNEPTDTPKGVVISKALAKRCIEALEYVAHMEAGQTQAPDLCVPKDYQEWDDAQELRRLLRTKP